MNGGYFEWDDTKNLVNIEKHGISFYEAAEAFADPNRLIAHDILHSNSEERWFCYGKTRRGIATVRFTYRDQVIRIFGAGYWRQGKNKYNQRGKR
ncbi:MAG: BrnT family toxin [Bifidobacterium aquikefiri]|uniref:BrnT family toxin n=1 Tax=Bifidobacterium aquikefiri TaxID=1653207 RepID=A0A261G6D8_9BIFI|nr:BrnT family toxin [Bifidobacterium aquikefiri]OZG66964.1 hypothetical protein BAQU_1036 [Bifidobacterium aquikefiri]